MSSIRLRLTLWYAAVLLIILGVVSLGVYLLVRDRLESMTRTRLDGTYAMVATVVRNSGGDLFDVAHLRDSCPFRLVRGGETVYRSRPWEQAQLSEVPDGGDLDPYASRRAPDGRRLWLKAGSTEYDFELTVAHDATAVEETIELLAVILLAGFPCALVLAVAGGYLLAARALSPVAAVTRKAREITAERLGERLPVRNPNDEIGRLAMVFNQTLARLESSFEQLRRFTADASHELRTPLTSIRSVGEVALRGPMEREACREAIGSMLEETDRLTRLLENLLTLARGESGRAQLSRRPAELTSLVGEVVEELRILAEEKDQTLLLDAPAPISVVVDVASLRQAVTNVLHNAIRYTPAGGHLEVGVALRGGQAAIEIIDDGPGIPAADRSKVFERFYRVDEARSRADGGAGLGLSIARWAVEANAGHIEFCDREDPGSCCRITLPLASDRS